MSLFVSFEGGEGSGKSTQIQLLADRLDKAGIDCLTVHEPGSTPLGWYVRDWLKRGVVAEDTISHNAELFLFAAARAELVTKMIQPALRSSSRVVIADRYVDSTIAYQGYGRIICLDDLAVINRLATHEIMPDMTILLDCTPEEGLARIGSFQLRLPLGSGELVSREEEGTRFEQEAVEFHRRLRAGYLKMAEQEPERWRVVDATGSLEKVAEVVWRHVSERLPTL